ncbi:MAG: T9SS type A sorting domain-containing protein, partial [Nitrososphaera sp.]|nr:T9SS type A sorting domain-containing protein [Nitrososphaera sp.]
SKSVTGLSSGVQYWYRVRAENSAGVSPNSNVIGLLKVTMSGPTTVYHADPKGQPANCHTWTANVTGGVPPYSYVWSWPSYGTNSSYSECFSWNGYGGGSYQKTFRVDVTDSQGATAFATKTFTAYNSSGGIAPRLGENGEIITMIPEEFDLSQNYPNPFNPETEISFALPEVSTVKLTVIDVLGREVLTLRDGQMSPGYHRVKWTGRNASGEQVGTGVYFYRLRAVGESGKEYVKTSKMLLAK